MDRIVLTVEQAEQLGVLRRLKCNVTIPKLVIPEKAPTKAPVPEKKKKTNEKRLKKPVVNLDRFFCRECHRNFNWKRWVVHMKKTDGRCGETKSTLRSSRVKNFGRGLRNKSGKRCCKFCDVN